MDDLIVVIFFLDIVIIPIVICGLIVSYFINKQEE